MRSRVAWGKPVDLASINAANKADVAALANLEKQRSVILAFEGTAQRNADVALKLSDRVDRTGVPILNQWILSGRSKVGGSGDVAAFSAAVETFTNEYAKLMSSATGSGVTSDEARKHAREMLNSAQTKEQFAQVMDVLKMDMANRRAGYDSQREEIQGRIRARGTRGQGAQGTPPAAPQATGAPVNNGPKGGRETLSRQDPRYQQLRQRGMSDAQIISSGVDPVWWTPHGWGGKECPRCRRVIGSTRGSSDSASSNWCGRDGRPKNWGVSSNPRPRRSGIGFGRPTVMLGGAKTG